MNTYVETIIYIMNFRQDLSPVIGQQIIFIQLKTILNQYLQNCKKRIYACFVDFCKAFHTVWRSGLFQKLLKLGVSGNFYKVVKHMYSNSKFIVKKDNLPPSKGKYEKCVRHGDGLSILLYNVYINDINKILTLPFSIQLL